MRHTLRSIAGKTTVASLLLAGCAPVDDVTAVAGEALTLRDPTSGIDVLGGPRFADGRFVLRGALHHKCLDFGAPPQVDGGPVFLYGCNGTAAQSVRVREVNARHHVELVAGDRCIAPFYGFALEGVRLELRACNGGDGQHWIVDGDSLRPVMNPDLVAAPEARRGEDRTALVLAGRRFDDIEQWEFRGEAGPDARPTSGFVRVSTAAQLVSALAGATENSVVEVAPGSVIDLTATPSLAVTAGVTLRGDRRGLGGSTRLTFASAGQMLRVTGARARITGLTMQGPWPNTDETVLTGWRWVSGPGGLTQVPVYAPAPNAKGVTVETNEAVAIDHNDLFAWSHAAVAVTAGDEGETCGALTSRVPRVTVARNYLHANRMDGLGYGVVAGRGGFPYIEGNTFMGNRHAVAADGRARTSYHAMLNLVLTSAPAQWWGGYTQDFDMHGTDGSDHRGGVAGEETVIRDNTFLATNRENFDLRGTPCYGAFFERNISRVSQGDALNNDGAASRLLVRDNQFNSSDPTNRLGAGDFDGDGFDDVIVATGRGWYVSLRGRTEWRFWNARTEPLSAVRFGDFDADGRTDALTVNPYGTWVSWGATSDWDRVSTLTPPLADVVVGDLSHDGRADVVWTDGSSWRVSRDARGPWQTLTSSTVRAVDLRVADFDADGRADVLAPVGSNWMYFTTRTNGFVQLRARGADTTTELIAADVTGDGRADMVRALGYTWQLSRGGTGAWETLASGAPWASVATIPAGRFDDAPGVDLITLIGRGIELLSGGRLPSQVWSWGEMR